MKQLKQIEGAHDFSTFTVELDPTKDHVRTIYKAEIKQFGPLVCIHIMGDGFLYKMVRSIVGAIADVGRGTLPSDAIGGNAGGAEPFRRKGYRPRARVVSPESLLR